MKFLGLFLVLLGLNSSQVHAFDAMDWPYWRGPEMNGISRERDLPEKWNPEGGEGSNLLWMNKDIASRSTPIVLNGKLYILVRDQPGTPHEGEKIVCVNAETGEKIWENRFNAYLTDVPDTRLCWSSVVGDPESGNIYAQLVCGLFVCLDGETGKVIWNHSMSEEYGLLSTYGGRTNYPIVYDNMVLISAVVIGWGDMAKPAHRFLALDKRNGQPIWFNGTRLFPEDTTYSSPMIGVVDGQAQLVFGSGDGSMYGFQPRTGKQLWKYDVSRRGINTSPLIVGNTVYGGHSEENNDSREMGAVFAIDASKSGDITKTGELWRNKGQFVGRSSPMMVDGKLLTIEDTGTLIASDPATGKRLFKTKVGRYAYGSPVYADGKLYVSELNGLWWILKVGADKFQELHKLRLDDHEIYASPIISHGRIYLATSKGVYCIGSKDSKPMADAPPEVIKEADVEADQKPAWVQVAPVESILRPVSANAPGQKQQFQVRLFNAKGQYLRLANPDEVQFELKGPGTIDANGKYSAPGIEGSHQATIVTAKVGELSGTARIRNVPPLDWSFDFNKGTIPETWVGIRYRNIVIDFDLFQELNKEDPQTAQLYLYFMTEFTNFNPKEATFDDSTPRETWTQLLRFLKLLSADKKPKNLEEAQATLDKSLTSLKEKGIISEWNWSTWSKKLEAGGELGGTRLNVKRGERKIQGNGVMVKISTIPKGTRSQGWMGQDTYTNYTVQADVYGALKDGRLPEIGLIDQRYCMKMMGEKQQLAIHTWYSSDKHMTETAPLEWKADVWYTMKFQVSAENGVAKLKGKVWVKGEPEPEGWKLEVQDEMANMQGSPGLFGMASVSEIFFDNIKVFQNK
jgi:outer membrane protein assembly factor BamB